jgi:hypothetical protein
MKLQLIHLFCKAESKNSLKANSKPMHQKTPSKERYEFLSEPPRTMERPKEAGSGDKVCK